MSRLPTVKIANPWGGHGYVIINERDFDTARHTPWTPSAAASAPEPTDDEAPEVPQLPDGYRAKHRGGGKYVGLVDGQPLKDAESGEVVLFDDRDAAESALARYAEAQQAEDGDE